MTWLKRWKWAVVAAAVVAGAGIALGLILGGLGSTSGATDQANRTYVVGRGDIKKSLTVYGKVVPAQEYTFTFHGDDVNEMFVKVGNRVKEGDVLVELDRTQAELNLLEAERALREAEAGGVPNTIRNKELSHQIALGQYNETTLRAPFAGVITRITQATSSSEMWSLKLIDTSQLYIEASVDQLDAPDVAVGQTAMALIEPLPDMSWTVEVVEVGGMATSSGNSTVVSVTALLAEAHPSILVGYTAEMEILTAHAEDVLIVPITCLRQVPRGWMVTKLIDGEETKQAVAIGAMSNQYVEIGSGLEEGDVILLNSTVAPSAPQDMSEDQKEAIRGRMGIPSGFPGSHSP